MSVRRLDRPLEPRFIAWAGASARVRGAGATDVASARGIIKRALEAGREMLDELEAKDILKAYGIAVVATVAVEAAASAASKAARELGYPVAVKILSPDISHKSDVGGVCLHLRDDNGVHHAVDEMLARVRRIQPLARIAGLTVQAMVNRPHAHELVLGASIDPLSGPVLLFGQGGTAVEVLGDRAIGVPALNRTRAAELIDRTRASRLLSGYRDRPSAKLDGVCDALIALSQMLADLPEIVELDINPLLADHDGVVALDARLRVSRKPEAGSRRGDWRPPHGQPPAVQRVA
jgi:acetyltransferase